MRIRRGRAVRTDSENTPRPRAQSRGLLDIASRTAPCPNTRDLRHAGLHEAVTWDFCTGLEAERAPGKGLGVEVHPFPGALVLSYLPDVADASRIVECQDAGTPAGTVVVRAAGLRVHGWTVTVGDAQPPAGELAVFCRPGVTAPARARRHGPVLADP